MSTNARVQELFSKLRRRWFPPAPQMQEGFLGTTGAFVDLQAELRSDKTPLELTWDLYPELGEPAPIGVAAEDAALAPRRAELHLVSQMLQIMEDTYLGAQLQGFHAHPLNRGWMNVFRRWTATETFQKFWPILRGEYSSEFVEFCEDQLDLWVDLSSVAPEPVTKNPRNDPQRAGWCRLLKEFAWEWPDQAKKIADLIKATWRAEFPRPTGANAKIDAGLKREGLQLEHLVDAVFKLPFLPHIWVVQTPKVLAVRCPDDQRQRTPLRFVCGVVVVWPRPATGEYEFFVWIRGAYRNLGIGRRCVRALLSGNARQLRGSPPELPQQFTLVSRYPEAGLRGAGAGLKKAAWLSFFYDFEFRGSKRIAQSDPGYLVVRRSFQ